MKAAKITHPDLMRALDGGEDLLSEVDKLAEQLRQIMIRIHGGEWSTGINHHAGCFVIVARDFGGKKR